MKDHHLAQCCFLGSDARPALNNSTSRPTTSAPLALQGSIRPAGSESGTSAKFERSALLGVTFHAAQDRLFGSIKYPRLERWKPGYCQLFRPFIIMRRCAKIGDHG